MLSNILKKIEKLMDNVSRYVLLIAFAIIFVVGLLDKAMYSFDDSPYFTLVKWYDVVIGIIIVSIYMFIFYKREWIQNRLNYGVCLVVFMIASVIYIVLVPTIPFSDMSAIYKGAVAFSEFNWSEMLDNNYWNVFPGNIYLAVFWGVLLIPLPKTLITFKILNALMLYGIAICTRKLSKEYGIKNYNLVYVCVLTFCPTFIYINHVYFDMPFVLLCMLSLYVYKKYNNFILSMGILGVAKYLRNSAMIFAIVLMVVHVFGALKEKDGESNRCYIKRILTILIGLILFISVYKVPSKIVHDRFINDNYDFYPVWNQFYIGINEPEFGFMDNDFSYDRSFQDIVKRVEEYGPWRMTKIFVKKTFWLWSQGTYQAQRYGFAADVLDEDELSKFEYQTILTNHLLRDEQPFRRILNSVMRAQYFVMFGLMVYAMFGRNSVDRYREFYYIFIATFLIMLVYELKSRYIFHLFPMMIIMAVGALETIEMIKKS